MGDRPILFSAPMIRAILDGRKTQTRRLGGFAAINDDPSRYSFLGIVSGPKVPHFAFRDLQTGDQLLIKCRVVKGDRLWVRENCWLYGKWRENGTTPKGRQKWTLDLIGKVAACERPKDIAYYGGAAGFAFRPGIHMPRWASRITLGATDVRVQRLQECSDEDAIAEGVARRTVECKDGVSRALWFGVPHFGNEVSPVRAYADLWDSINNPHGYCPDDEPKGWEANPWVVALTFTVERRNIDVLQKLAA